MHKIELSKLTRSEIEDEIYRLQKWVEIEKSKGVNIDELLDRVVCIEIRMNNNKLLYIEGLFQIDSLNVVLKTCHIFI